MTISMKLDAPAVRKLIEDEEFRLDLQAAVIAEVVRGLFDKAVPNVMREMIDSAFKDQRDTLKKIVAEDTEFRSRLDRSLEALVQSIRAGTNIYMTQRALSEEAKRLIDNHVKQKITDEVDKRKGEMDERVDAMILRFEKRFEAEIEGKIEKMDKAYYDIAHRAIMEKFVAFYTK